jgi:hypothetical protein
LDSQNNIIISGDTNSTNFPTTPGVFQEIFAGGTKDGVLIKFSTNRVNRKQILANWLTPTDDQNGDSKVNSLDFAGLVTGN